MRKLLKSQIWSLVFVLAFALPLWAATAWQAYRTGVFDRTSDNADSPWYDAGAQTALASCPYAADVTDTWNSGAFALTAPAGVVSGTGAGTIAATGSLTTGASAFTMGALTLADGAATAFTSAGGAFTCGTVTLSGVGAFTTAAGALVCTSITTTAAKAGTVTIGAGGATFAGVCNNAGTGTLSITGNCTGCTTLTMGNYTQATGTSFVATTVVGPGAGQTCTMTGTAALTGLTASVANFLGTWTIGAGGALTANSASTFTLACNTTGVFTVDGTSGAGIVTLGNTGAGALNFILNDLSVITFANVKGGFNTNAVGGGFYVDCQINFNGGRPQPTSYPPHFKRCFIYGYTGASRFWFDTANIPWIDVAWGYDRAGTSYTFPAIESAAQGTFRINGLICSGGAPVSVGVGTQWAIVDNFGHLDPTMLPGTASALDTAQVQAGIGKSWRYQGTIERGTSLPKQGETFELHETPSSIVTATRPLKARIAVPVVTGDLSVVATFPVARYVLASTTPATITVDAEGAWTTTVSHTPTMTLASLSGTGATTNAAPGTTLTYATGGFNATVTDNVSQINVTSISDGGATGWYLVTGHTDTTLTLATSPGASKTAIAFYTPNWYTATATTGAIGGTAAKGTIGVDLICGSFTTAGQLVYAGGTIVVTHANGSSTKHVVSHQNWQDGHPVVDQPIAVIGGR